MGDLRRLNPEEAKAELRPLSAGGCAGVPVADPLYGRRDRARGGGIIEAKQEVGGRGPGR